jgi:hypothetical protein
MTDPEAKQAPTGPNAPGPAPSPDAAPPAGDRPDLIGGRVPLAVAMLGLISLVSWQTLNGWLDRALHPRAPKPVATWQTGAEADVELTLITADAKRLLCAHDTELEGTHCGYGANKRPWRRVPDAPFDDNDAAVIQPYRTADTNALILVSGIWAQPELALRLHREPPNLANVDKHLRFVAYCRVRFTGELKDVSTRWDTGGKWAEEPTAFVAKALRCTLQPPNG